MTKTPERPQLDRLKDNIEIIDDLATGKGRAFIQPGTAKEIAKDLRDLEQRVLTERKSADLFAKFNDYRKNPTEMGRRDLAGALGVPVDVFIEPDEMRRMKAEAERVRRAGYSEWTPDAEERRIMNEHLRHAIETGGSMLFVEQVDENGIVLNGPFAGAERRTWEGVKFVEERIEPASRLCRAADLNAEHEAILKAFEED
jgi:hypothetical protein